MKIHWIGLFLFAIFAIVSIQRGTFAAQPTLAPSVSKIQDTSEIVPIKGSSPAVYLRLADNTIRHIQNWDTFIALGFQPQDIVEVSDESLAEYELGASISRWIVSDTDAQVYMVSHGERIAVDNLADWTYLEGNPLEISIITPALLKLLPESNTGIPTLFTPNTPAPILDAIWQDNDLCIVRYGDAVDCWNPLDNIHTLIEVDEQVTSLSKTEDGIALVGTESGNLWQIGTEPQLVTDMASSWLAEITPTSTGGYFIDRNAFQLATNNFTWGQGIMQWDTTQNISQSLPNQPRALADATALVTQDNLLWVGTRYAGLWQFDGQKWQSFTTPNSGIPDDTIYDLAVASDGSLWLSIPHRLARLKNGNWHEFHLRDSYSVDYPAFALQTYTNQMWFAGENVLGYWQAGQGGALQTFTAFDHPYFLDNFAAIVPDTLDNLWFVGYKRVLQWSPTDQIWTAYPYDTGTPEIFNPAEPNLAPIPEFPSPTADYENWLQTWERPTQDTGRCIHYLQFLSGSRLEVREQIARMESLGMRWALVNYPARSHLLQMAPLFAEANISVIWRPFVRADEEYAYWAEDVHFLRALGLPPYIQLYNEPSLAQEWASEVDISEEVYLQNLLSAYQTVYEAGGYTGLQHLDPNWTRATIQAIQEENLPLDRLFFVPHPYGLNHPPEYDNDWYSVLGFLDFADVFAEEIGFVPMMVAGEGGWRLGEQQDARFPAITEELHRDYHVEVFDWFATGQLSNGEALPDYLFALCPWLISDPNDAAAWFDNDTDNRQLTIDAVRDLPLIERQFSWDEE